MTEPAALDWARFLVEQQGINIAQDDFDSGSDLIRVDEDKAGVPGFKIVMFIQTKIQQQLVFFRPDKEDKMKLIIGEKLQESKNSTKALVAIQRHRSDSMTFEQMKDVFVSAGLSFSKETYQCCFIFLLRKQ